MKKRDANQLNLFSYYGGKSKIAHLYPAPIGDTLIEPFAGAANYSCLHYRKQVILYEINPTVAGVLDWLVKASPSEVMKLPLLKPKQSIEDLKGLPQEVKDYIGFRLNWGVTHPRNTLSKQRIGTSTGWGELCRQRTAWVVKRIKHWKVINGTCWDAFAKHGAIKTINWYIDPPYQGRGGDAYIFGNDLIDYKKLGQAVRALRGKVIVAEGMGANWLPFQELPVPGFLNGNRTKVKEVIWTKGFPEPETLFNIKPGNGPKPSLNNRDRHFQGLQAG